MQHRIHIFQLQNNYYGLTTGLKRPLQQRVSNPQHSCTTPDGERGNCVNIEQCPNLFNMFMNKARDISDTMYLRKSHCGKDYTMPNVCCAHRQQSSDTLPLNAQCGKSKRNAPRISGGNIVSPGELYLVCS